MKITKTRLKEIIKEELEAAMEKEVVSELFGFGNKFKKLSDDQVWKGMRDAIKSHPVGSKEAEKWIEEYRKRALKDGRDISDINGAIYKLQYPKEDAHVSQKDAPESDAPRRKYNKAWDDKDWAKYYDKQAGGGEGSGRYDKSGRARHQGLWEENEKE
jgi:hypothetical protein